jgi:type IV pilus assembly protein PilW
MKSHKTLGNQLHGSDGFSLIELMVAIAIVGIVLIALAATFQRSGRLYTTQNVSASLQEEVRAAVEIMAREIRMAGYDPQKTGNFEIFQADATHIRFNYDQNENGIEDNTSFPNCERISFRYSNANEKLDMICREGMGGVSPQPLIGDSDTRVTQLNFDYRTDQDISTNNLLLIRGVVLTLTAEAPAGRDGMIQRSYSTRVEVRNAAPNSNL